MFAYNSCRSFHSPIEKGRKDGWSYASRDSNIANGITTNYERSVKRVGKVDKKQRLAG